MANDNLRTALERAGLGPDQLGDLVEVDSRSVRRWLSGQTPSRRHRAKIVRPLDTPEQDLWPDLPSEPDDEPKAGRHVNEIITGYARADHFNVPSTATLIQSATARIDLLDETLKPLLTRPGAIELLTSKADYGCQIRILVNDPGPYLTPLLGRDGIEVHGARAKRIGRVHRVDDHIVATFGFYPNGDRPPPLLELERRTDDGLFDWFADYFETSWQVGSRAIETEDDLAAYPAASAAPQEPSASKAEPTTNRSQTRAAQPRRWPGRRPDD